MLARFTAAVGSVALAAAMAIPSGPAQADRIRNDQWHLDALKVAEAQAISKGAGVTVAVIDTGVSAHPDLKRNLLAGTSVASGASGDGQADNNGHGTQMAALIAAHGKNSQDGILGIAPSARILPVKDSNDNRAPAEPMAEGITWATKHGAKVINVSAGTGPALDLVDAVGAAIQNDIVVVAAAGNRDAVMGYPGKIDGVLAVGATDRAGAHASFSVKDAKIQICAPGTDIRTAGRGGKYVTVDGTSASTAVVSGAAALVRAKFPDMSATEVVDRLTSTADDIGPPGRDDECGFGRLNIVKALTADVAPAGGVTTAPSAVVPAPGADSSAAVSGDDASAAAASVGPLLLGVLAVMAGLALVGGLVAVVLMRRRHRF